MKYLSLCYTTFTSSYYFPLDQDVLNTTLSYTFHVLLLSGRSSIMPIRYKHTLCAQEGKSGVQTWSIQWETTSHNRAIQRDTDILLLQNQRTALSKHREIVFATHTCFKFHKETKKSTRKTSQR